MSEETNQTVQEVEVISNTNTESKPKQSNEYTYSQVRFRLLASIIDGIILSVVSGIIGVIIGIVFGVSGGSDNGVIAGQAISSLFSFVIGWLYFAYQESSEEQATIGKKIFNIKVTDIDGNRISFARASGRHFAKIISSAVLMIGYIMAIFTEKKQGLHDIIASTLVMRKS